ncbi:SH3 domain-containing protein [Reichenbachiella agariperforans]|uniref:SH3 domain-containing protein n=1 Tax=Reichenbachiella agariperforans TaxID=156994 RepID=A0A1M6JX28_REIAG|nr:C40 family peptidase [Reichenbachiella agariperforans]SHJ51267.1 SH3 domain-containing protein [Reichenbachiella agariperforans]
MPKLFSLAAMKLLKTTWPIAILLTLVWSGCHTDSWRQIGRLEEINDSIRVTYAPDKRVAVYDISLLYDKGQVKIIGETNQPAALEVLEEQLLLQEIRVDNQAITLPDSSVGEMAYALVNNSVCNIRSEARHSAELATQALLGMTLKVLKRTGEWYLVQTPDGYISWVDHGGVQLMTASEQLRWSKSPQVIYLHNYGNVYADAEESAIVSDVVLGDRLVARQQSGDHVEVVFPDGRLGYVRQSEVTDFKTWKENVSATGDGVMGYALDLLGTPYLWGGTSAKGVDCSGFTKTAYLMNGYVIPRDASQQIHAGQVVDPALKFEGLAKGDLMFFGRAATDTTQQRVTHVGLWMGDSTFVHASRNVRVSSVDPASEFYDESNTNRYLGSRRYLGNERGISKWY